MKNISGKIIYFFVRLSKRIHFSAQIHISRCQCSSTEDPFISKIAFNYIGSKNLIEQIRDHLIRIDIPTETQGYLTEEEKSEDLNLLLPWHQDYPYNQGSKKSLTIYLPLQEAKVNEGGTLEVAVASHKKGLLKHIKKTRKTFFGKKQIESVCLL